MCALKCTLENFIYHNRLLHQTYLQMWIVEQNYSRRQQMRRLMFCTRCRLYRCRLSCRCNCVVLWCRVVYCVYYWFCFILVVWVSQPPCACSHRQGSPRHCQWMHNSVLWSGANSTPKSHQHKGCDRGRGWGVVCERQRTLWAPANSGAHEVLCLLHMCGVHVFSGAEGVNTAGGYMQKGDNM